jgi:hypothetical protein
VRQDQGERRCVKIRREVRQGCYLSPIFVDLFSGYLTRELLEVFGNFKVGKLIRTVKYADAFLLLVKEGGLTEIGRCDGKEMNVGKP